MGAQCGQGARKTLHLDQARLSTTALRKSGGWEVDSQNVWMAVLTQTVGLIPAFGIEPGPRGELDDIAANVLRHDGPGEAGASFIEDMHDVPVGDTAGARIVGMYPGGLTPFYLGTGAVRAMIELAVQALNWLVRDKVEWVMLSGRGPQPFLRLDPNWISRAVWNLVGGDTLAIDLDLA